MDEFVEIPNVSTAEKPLKRCERCDTETEHYVEFIYPEDNSMHTVCWSCREREDKNFNMRPNWHFRERSGGRFLPNSPKD